MDEPPHGLTLSHFTNEDIMRIKTIGILVIAAAVIGGGGYGLHHYLASSAQSEAYVTDLSSGFSADREIKDALTLYQKDSCPKARILKPPGGEEKRMYLFFSGLPDRPMIEKLTDLLEKEKSEAAFFAEGQNVLDEEQGMKVLHKQAALIGNYTWLGRPRFEMMKPEAAIASVVKTQQAIHLMEGSTPLYFKAPNTKYTDDLLKVLGACGVKYAVESSITIRRGQLKSASDAKEIVKKLKSGSIIAFEVNRPLDIKVKEQGAYDEKPAIDKKPTIKDSDFIDRPAPHDMAEEVSWLIDALKEAGYELGGLESISVTGN